MTFQFRKDRDGIMITGALEPGSVLRLPEEIDGLPVRGVEKSAFSRRRDLTFVQLPKSLRFLGRFAFYACSALEIVEMGGGITDYGDGVFRQCGALAEVRLDLTGGDCTVLRELLADRDSLLRVRLTLPEGEACLTFPDYVMDFDEDTRARALHTRIEGAGFAYRECVSRRGIDFRAYDAAFTRISRTEIPLAVRIALDRLCAPYGLEKAAQGDYETFLRGCGETCIRQVLETGREEWLRLLLERNLLAPETKQLGLRLASEAGKTAFVSLLMKAAPKGGGRFRL